MPTSQIVERPAELLAYLFASRAEVKRAKLRQWLKHGSIHVNGKSITRFDHALQIGDVVSVRTKKEVLANALLPPALKVLFEDLSLIVIVKPESLLSMASETGTAQDGVCLADRLCAPRQSSQPGTGMDCPPLGPRSVRANGFCKDGRSEAGDAIALV